MDMELTEEQQLLKNSARDFLSQECTPDVVRELEVSDLGFSRELWQKIADLGWLGLPLPAEDGGMGLGHVDLAVLAKEMGRALFPGPFIPSVVLAGGAIAAAGSNQQKQDLLTRLIAGEQVIAFAFQEGTNQYDLRRVAMRAELRNGTYYLNGSKMFVEFANAADYLLVVARTDGAQGSPDGLTMFIVDPKADGVRMSGLPTMAKDRQFRIDFEGVAVPEEAVVGRPAMAAAALEAVLDRGVVTFAAYALGAAERMHELATEFAKGRVQFGRPIGSFQLIQSYLATLITEIWGAETLVYYTAWALDEGMPARELIAKSKGFAGDVVKRTTDVGSQIFGGIGYIEGVDSTLYLRRGKQYQLMMGDTGYWEDVIADEILGPVPA
jgi:alkylation response protein AidB-like acyl-CoA dehydrogenase